MIVKMSVLAFLVLHSLVHCMDQTPSILHCWRIGNWRLWSLNTQELKKEDLLFFFFLFFFAVTVYHLFVEKVFFFLSIYMYLPVILTIAAVSFNSVYRLNTGGIPVIFVMIMFQFKAPLSCELTIYCHFYPKQHKKIKKEIPHKSQ